MSKTLFSIFRKGSSPVVCFARFCQTYIVLGPIERLLFLALKSLKNLSDLFLPDSVGSVGSCVLGGIFGTVCAPRIFKTPGVGVVVEKIANVFSENPKRDIVTKSG